MSNVVADIEALIVRINQMGDRAVKGVSDIMQDEGEKIRDLAIEYAPVDKGNLEDAIEKTSSLSGINNRTEVTVWVDGDRPAGDGKTVGDYAMVMHEALLPWGSGGDGSDEYHLGMASRIKDGGRGVVGGKFLERAMKDREESLIKRAIDRVRKAYLK